MPNVVVIQRNRKSLCALVAGYDNGSLTVSYQARLLLEKEGSDEEMKSLAEVQTFFQSLSQVLQRKRDVAVVSPVDSVSLRPLTLPVLPSAQIRNTLKYQLETILPGRDINKEIVESLELQRRDTEVDYLCLSVPKKKILSTLDFLSSMGYEPTLLSCSLLGVLNFLFWRQLPQTHPHILGVGMDRDNEEADFFLLEEGHLRGLKSLTLEVQLLQNPSLLADRLALELTRYLYSLGKTEDFHPSLFLWPPEADLQPELSQRLDIPVLSLDLNSSPNPSSKLALAEGVPPVENYLDLVGLALSPVIEVAYPVDFRQEEFGLVNRWEFLGKPLKVFLGALLISIGLLLAILFKEIEVYHREIFLLQDKIKKSIAHVLPGKSFPHFSQVEKRLQAWREEAEFAYGSATDYPIQKTALDTLAYLYQTQSALPALKFLSIDVATRNGQAKVQAQAPNASVVETFKNKLTQEPGFAVELSPLTSTKEGMVTFTLVLQWKAHQE